MLKFLLFAIFLFFGIFAANSTFDDGQEMGRSDLRSFHDVNAQSLELQKQLDDLSYAEIRDTRIGLVGLQTGFAVICAATAIGLYPDSSAEALEILPILYLVGSLTCTTSSSFLTFRNSVASFFATDDTEKCFLDSRIVNSMSKRSFFTGSFILSTQSIVMYCLPDVSPLINLMTVFGA